MEDTKPRTEKKYEDAFAQLSHVQTILPMNAKSPSISKKYLLLVVFLFAVSVRIIFLHGTKPSIFWDTESYVAYATFLKDHLRPPGVGIRAMGYPLFLLIFGNLNLNIIIIIQQLLGIASVVLLFLIMDQLTANSWISAATAIFHSLSVDVLFMEVTIYSETLAIFLLLLTIYAYLRVMADSTRLNLSLLGVSTTLLAITRAIFQVLIPLVAIFVLVPSLKRRGLKQIMPLLWFLMIPTIAIGTYSTYNFLHDRHFRIAIGKAVSLDYVGFPEIYLNLPQDMSYIRSIYEEKAKESGQSYVGWGQALGALMDAQKKRGQPYEDWDESAFFIFKKAVYANPKGYLVQWSKAFRDYMRDYFVWYGLYRNNDLPGDSKNSQVSIPIYRCVRSIEKLFKFIQPVLSYLALFSLILALIFRRSREVSDISVLLVSLMFVSITLLNTSLEPSLGQARYRMVWQGIIIMLNGVWVNRMLNLFMNIRNKGRVFVGNIFSTN